MISESEQCEVVFPYKSVNEDELDLMPGQVIQVISKELEDPGWWKGSFNGKIGVFPDNFVKIVTTKPVPKKSGSIEEKYEFKKELNTRFVFIHTLLSIDTLQ